jgi:tryptophan synthase alpha chain
MFKNYVAKQKQKNDILLMTHMVIGYPSIEESERIVDEMVAAGVDLIELQIPFSEPIADGPVILRANQLALERGVSVQDCLDFTARMKHKYFLPFFYMTYVNIIHKYGIDAFLSHMLDISVSGAIVPDLPPEEGMEYIEKFKAKDKSLIFIYGPTTSDERMKYIASHASGFIYCVARKGVTGANTSFSENLDQYLKRCRAATDLPLALGFGVKDRSDIDFLTGKVDIAVVGTQTIKVMEKNGIGAIGPYLRSLRG